MDETEAKIQKQIDEMSPKEAIKLAMALAVCSDTNINNEQKRDILFAGIEIIRVLTTQQTLKMLVKGPETLPMKERIRLLNELADENYRKYLERFFVLTSMIEGVDD